MRPAATRRRASTIQRRTASAAVVALSVVLAAGCAQIPRSSPVHTITAPAKNADPAVIYRLQGPKDGATQEEVIDGFLQSNKGVQENLTHAREYIASGKRNAWRPEMQTTVYSSFPKIVPTSDPDRFEIHYQPVAEIDERGIRRNTPNAPAKTASVHLVKENGQYRLDGVPNELLISVADAKYLLVQRNLYFYSPDFSHAVPDTRWFLESPKQATNVLNALVKGPAPHLKGAVASSFTKDTANAGTSVAVIEKQAQVDFPAEYWNGLKTLERQQIKQQLDLTFKGLQGTESVAIRTDARQVPDLGTPSSDFVTVQADPPADGTMLGVSGDQLVWYTGTDTQKIEGAPNTSVYAPRQPALSYTKKQFTFLNASSTQMLSTGPGREVVLSLQAQHLTPPSFDTSNWAWTVARPSGSGPEQVRAVAPGGAAASAVTVDAPWLKGYTVSDLRVARDGVRVAVVAHRKGEDILFLSAIARDDDGAPQRLTSPETVPTGTGESKASFNTVRWMSDSQMVLANLGADQQVKPTLVSPGGIDEVLYGLPGATDMAVGNEKGEIYLIAGGKVYSRVGSSWYRWDKPIAGLNFVG